MTREGQRGRGCDVGGVIGYAGMLAQQLVHAWKCGCRCDTNQPISTHVQARPGEALPVCVLRSPPHLATQLHTIPCAQLFTCTPANTHGHLLQPCCHADMCHVQVHALGRLCQWLLRSEVGCMLAPEPFSSYKDPL